MSSALIIVATGAEEIESISVVDILHRGGVEVTIASLTDEQTLDVKCAHGTTIHAGTTLAQVGDNYDVIIIPGGIKGATNCGKSALVGDLLKKQHANGKLVAAICAAPGFVLAKNGLLTKDIPSAGYPGCEQGIPNYQTDGVIVDLAHKIITGRGPAYAMSFGLAILTAITNQATADKVATGMLLNE